MTKDAIVLKEPQKPISKSNEYFISRFQYMDKIENTPRMKLPTIFIIRMLMISVPITIKDETNLYLRNTPTRVVMPNKRNSSSFNFQSPAKFQFY